MAGESKGEKANGRHIWKVDGTVAVTGTNTDWFDSDVNGSSTDLAIEVRWDNTKAFFAFKFGNTDELFILCSDTV